MRMQTKTNLVKIRTYIYDQRIGKFGIFSKSLKNLNVDVNPKRRPKPTGIYETQSACFQSTTNMPLTLTSCPRASTLVRLEPRLRPPRHRRRIRPAAARAKREGKCRCRSYQHGNIQCVHTCLLTRKTPHACDDSSSPSLKHAAQDLATRYAVRNGSNQPVCAAVLLTATGNFIIIIYWSVIRL